LNFSSSFSFKIRSNLG